jgi:hypothetical protein
VGVAAACALPHDGGVAVGNSAEIGDGYACPWPGVRPGDDPRRGPPSTAGIGEVASMGSVIKKRRKRMAKKKHRKLLKKTRVQRRNKK